MAAQPTSKKIRQTRSKSVHDPLNIANLTFNKASGAQKNMTAGHHLKPILIDPSTDSYTTDATTARAVRPGTLLAIYNNNTAVGSVTLGDDASVPALAVGVTDTSGRVGIACKPADWTYISMYDKKFVRTGAATLLVYIIEDDTYISDESISR